MRIDSIFVLLSALSACVNPRVFYFFPGNVTWPEAQKYCRQNHSDLATVDDQTDYDELLKTGPGDFKGEMWIGLYRENANAPWIWSDQSKSTFRLWGSGQPNNYLGHQFCMGTSLAGQWNDLDCPDKKAFICYTVKKRNVVRLEVKSNQHVNGPSVKAEILVKIQQILKEKGLTEDAKLLWKIQSDGNVFQKNRKSDATQQTCL